MGGRNPTDSSAVLVVSHRLLRRRTAPCHDPRARGTACAVGQAWPSTVAPLCGAAGSSGRAAAAEASPVSLNDHRGMCGIPQLGALFPSPLGLCWCQLASALRGAPLPSCVSCVGGWGEAQFGPRPVTGVRTCRASMQTSCSPPERGERMAHASKAGARQPQPDLTALSDYQSHFPPILTISAILTCFELC